MTSLFRKLVITTAAFAATAAVQAAPVDDYKAFGSVAALSEQCLNSSQISERINIVVPAAVQKNPEITPIMESLIQAYNAAYTKAMVDGQIWEASNSGNFGFSRPINCRNQEDVKKIRFLHDYFLKALN